MYYDVTYACGHNGRVQIYGPGKERELKAEREAEKMCRACYIAKQRQAAWKRAIENSFPDLRGTEKQIDWAMQIREHLISNYENAAVPDRYAQAVDYVIGDMTRTQTSAAWWIERRSYAGNVETMVRDYLQENPSVYTQAKRYITQREDEKQ